MNSPTILLVDDDSGMMDLLSMRLQSAGYRTLCADCGTAALAAMEERLPEMVMTDLRMEEMDGLTLFEEIHRRWPSLPVVVLTAHGSIAEAVKATQQGVYSFLTKPVDKDELLSTIERALQTVPEKQSDQPEEGPVITRSPKMFNVLEQTRLLAQSEVNVLLTGESGTGKELIARELHRRSHRADKPFVPVNCSAIPADMLESELFGHVKGAFTGAIRDHQGLFAAAHQGFLFLDEIGDMPLPLQAKLLRVLQDKTIRPVGGTENINIDVRVVSATHKDLFNSIQQGDFREDLFYRLNVVNIALPSLRQRREDILLLANYFLNRIADRNRGARKQLSPQAIGRLLEYNWPGNVRQLENVMEQCAALSPSTVISETLVTNAIPGSIGNSMRPLSEAKRDFEREYIATLLKSTDGNMRLAAKLAGRNRSDFYKIVSRHRLDVTAFKR
ncbi:response regulator [Proteobacteria bacterium 005FR1]|nr:response regulator [Proteobacteria bacterium 005FR1]